MPANPQRQRALVQELDPRLSLDAKPAMNTHLRKLIQQMREEGWEYIATQTNGTPHFVHPLFGKVVVASTPADWEDECQYTLQRIRKATRRYEAELGKERHPHRDE